MSKRKMIQIKEVEKSEFKIALYERVSTEFQAEEGYSIDIQKERLEAYAKSLTATPQSITHYTDSGFSGATLQRPAMEKLVLDVKNGDITHVIVYKLDRLSRSQKDTLYLIEDVFIPYNISFISIQESFNTATPFGRAVIGILSVFAQLERENIFERTYNGKVKRIESGYWLGGHTTPYGYDYDKEKGILIPNKDADKVKKMFELYINGDSEQTIARLFGIKYDRMIHGILTRRAYTGYIKYGGKYYPGLHEPLIDEETFFMTQKCMRERREKKFVTKTSYLFTGLIECGVCGAKMRYQKWSTGTRIWCYSQQISKPYLVKDPSCNNDKIDGEEFDKIVLDEIFHLSIGFHDKSMDENSLPTKSTMELLQEQLQIAENKIRRLYNLYAESNDDYLMETINAQKEEIEVIKARIEEELKKESLAIEAENTRQKIKDIATIWDYLTQKEKITMIRTIIDKIIITHQQIKIIYKI